MGWHILGYSCFSRSFAQSLTLPLIRPMVCGMTGVLTPREKVAINILLLIKLGKKLGLPFGEMDNHGYYIASISKLTKIFYVSLYHIFLKVGTHYRKRPIAMMCRTVGK